MGKGGNKYVNPADKARKEARKKELKKNKKQRALVRTTLLKNKDPLQILADLERLDQQEYNIHQPPTLAEKVLKDKRRKLTETWNRVIALYRKEDTNRFLELKRLERDYEAKRDQMAKLYNAVKSAEEVVLDEIPLPVGPVDETSAAQTTDDSKCANIFKTKSFGKRLGEINKKPPGCPPSIPPKISELEAELADFVLKNEAKKSVDEDLNQFLKEIDQVKKVNTNEENKGVLTNSNITSVNVPPAIAANPLPPIGVINPTLPIISPINVMSSVHTPVVPPLPFNPSIAAQVKSTNYLPNLPAGNATLPRMFPQAPANNVYQYTGNVASHRMMGRMNRPEMKTETVSQATIEAKPQLRNLCADTTRFLPVSLRVKRNGSKLKDVSKFSESSYVFTSEKKPLNGNTGNQKDLAYEQFMNEMKDFL